ncbi:beta-ketoacyl-[acyl-carrier-protein] synthase II, partial [bacterium]
MGTFNPCGNSVQETWDNVSSGRSGIARIEAFDVSDYDSKIGGEVKGFDPLKFMDKKDARHTDRSAQFAVAASIEAMDGVDTSDFDTTKFGVIIGSGIGGIKTFEAQHTVLMERGPSR